MREIFKIIDSRKVCDAGDFICLTGGLCDAGDYMLDKRFLIGEVGNVGDFICLTGERFDAGNLIYLIGERLVMQEILYA